MPKVLVRITRFKFQEFYVLSPYWILFHLYSSKETRIFASVCHNTGIERISINSQRPDILFGKMLWKWRKTECEMNERISCNINFLVFINATFSFTAPFEFRTIIVFKSLILLSHNTLFQINIHFKMGAFYYLEIINYLFHNMVFAKLKLILILFTKLFSLNFKLHCKVGTRLLIRIP